MVDNQLKISSKYKPSPAQASAIAQLVEGLKNETKHQVLLGVTGSGKTFAMANIIEQIQKPTLILAHNKTLAAQLFAEFKEFFPENAVKYFVSYYDFYQPEAYIPQRDLYIEKESEINKVIEKYRNSATQSLMSRKDTIIIASVSCIYGLGDPEDYLELSRHIEIDQQYSREKLLRHLADMQYDRSEIEFTNGLFRVRGDTIEIYLSSEDKVVRIEYFGDQIEQIKIVNPVGGEILDKPKSFEIFPAKHFVTPYETLKQIIPQIETDLKNEVEIFGQAGKTIEAYRLEQRVKFDIEMLRETGYCSGIENYSRYIDRRIPGTPPSTLLDYFPDNWLLFIDESHITLPQVRGMYHGDLARKTNLVDYGFRLRASLDNRPLKYSEFWQKIDQVIYCSATPNDFELSLAKENDSRSHQGISELLVRPTGLLDPIVEIKPSQKEYFVQIKSEIIKNKYSDMEIAQKQEYKINQIDDLIIEVKHCINRGQRALVTTLTKRMAEDLATYLDEAGIKVTYIHSELDAIKRVELLRDLRIGKYDVLVGINLLREGLDLPEVSLILILDADKEGFLRSRSSLIQIIGRAARHVEGRVILYANHITDSMKNAIDETRRRRQVQHQYNLDNNIVPTSIHKEIKDILQIDQEDQSKSQDKNTNDLFKQAETYPILSSIQQKQLQREIEVQMSVYADMLEFEKAAQLRDLLQNLNKKN